MHDLCKHFVMDAKQHEPGCSGRQNNFARRCMAESAERSVRSSADLNFPFAGLLLQCAHMRIQSALRGKLCRTALLGNLAFFQ